MMLGFHTGEDGTGSSGGIGGVELASEVDKWELILNDLDIPVGKLTAVVGQVTIRREYLVLAVLVFLELLYVGYEVYNPNVSLDHFKTHPPKTSCTCMMWQREEEQSEQQESKYPPRLRGLKIVTVLGIPPHPPPWHASLPHPAVVIVSPTTNKQVGSGKSSLVSALLGEMTRVSGGVSIDGSVAYVAQTAWIINATMKENLLMGRPFDQARYKKVLEVCDMAQVCVDSMMSIY